MKHTHVLATALVLALPCRLALAGNLPWESKLPFKEATIEYQLSGSQKGIDVLFIQDYGKLRVKTHKATTTVLGMATVEDTVVFTDQDWVTTYNLAKKTGNKITNPNKLYMAEYNTLTPAEKKNVEKNAQQLGASFMGQFGGEVKRSRTQLLGYDCDVTSMGTMSTVSIIHGTDIPLRSEVSVMGVRNTVIATRIDTTTTVPASLFAPPTGITPTLDKEADVMMSQTVHTMMATLKKPEGLEELKNRTNSSLPAGPQSHALEEALSGDKEQQQQMMQEMEKGMEMLKQMNRPKQ